MEPLIYFILAHHFLMIIYFKLKIRDKLRYLSVKLKLRFLYELSECVFCQTFWVGFILSLSILTITGNKEVILFSLYSTSFLSLVNKLNINN